MPHLVLTCIWSPPLTIDELPRFFFSCTQNTSRTSNVSNTPLSFIFVNLDRFPDNWIVANMSSMPSISRILPQPPRPSPFLYNKLMKWVDLWLLGAFICTINANGTPHRPCCLTSVIWRELVYSTWYGRWRGYKKISSFYFNNIHAYIYIYIYLNSVWKLTEFRNFRKKNMTWVNLGL